MPQALNKEVMPEKVSIQLDPLDPDTAHEITVTDAQAEALVQILKQHNSMAVTDVTIPRVRWYHYALHPEKLDEGWVTLDQWEEYDDTED